MPVLCDLIGPGAPLRTGRNDCLSDRPTARRASRQPVAVRARCAAAFARQRTDQQHRPHHARELREKHQCHTRSAQKGLARAAARATPRSHFERSLQSDDCNPADRVALIVSSTERLHCRSLGEGGGVPVGRGCLAEESNQVPGGVPPHPDDLSSLCQSAPLEVDRSSSQSALSERSGRWNGRVWWTCVLASIVVTSSSIVLNSYEHRTRHWAESALRHDCSH